MQCPNCKKELIEGYLYCESCGYEIQMVPDFEPEVDGRILNSLREIQKEAFEEELKEAKARKKEEAALLKSRQKWSYRLKKYRQEHKKSFTVFVSLLAVFLILLGIGIFLLVEYLSPGMQYSKAMRAYEDGDYSKSLKYVEHTLMLKPDYRDAYIAGFQCTFSLGNYSSAEVYLLQGLDYSAYEDTEVDYCFNQLIEIYLSNQQYKKISELLVKCPSSVIVKKYQDYLSLPVSFSYTEGTYEGTIPLKLSSGSDGTIYYTTDGTEPKVGGMRYKSPLFLEVGEYTISALFVNEYGVQSEIVTKSYVIEKREIPLPPLVNCYSGEYILPEMITVASEDNCDVYYTTDGLVPTEISAKYTDPIPLPLGKTQFKFVCYNEESGYFSDVVSREYEFTLNTEYEYTQAERDIYALMINENIILDYAGTRSNFVGRNSYEYQYVLTEEEMGEFYLISEFYHSDEGEKQRTGICFAVNVYDGTIYRAEFVENMDCVLSLY